MRIAVLGLGEAGTTLHLPALRGLRDCHVVGAADVDPKRRARASAQWRIPTLPDRDALLAETRPDVLIVATPPNQHLTDCVQALRAGAHVICEKPLAGSVAEADTILAEAAAAGRQVALNHEFRTMPIFRSLCAHIGSPGVGDLRFVQVWQQMHRPPWDETGWRGRLQRRTLYEAGVHQVDLLLLLFGERPRSVSASVSTCGAHDEGYDAVAVTILEFSAGRLGQIVQSRLSPGERRYFDVRADCDEACLRASFGGHAHLSGGLVRSTRPHLRLDWGVSGLAWLDRGGRRQTLSRNPRRPGLQATRATIRDTLQAFRRGEAPPVSGAVGRDTLLVIATGYHSAELGRRLPFQDPPTPAIHALQLAG